MFIHFHSFFAGLIMLCICLLYSPFAWFPSAVAIFAIIATCLLTESNQIADQFRRRKEPGDGEPWTHVTVVSLQGLAMSAAYVGARYAIWERL
jgi:hypothetical protein